MKAPLVILGGTIEEWGFIPGFLDTDDPRSAKEQLNAHYVSGWQHFEGFRLDPVTGNLTYPGDPPYRPLSHLFFRDERLTLYPSGWVMVMQPDDTWEICRMD